MRKIERIFVHCTASNQNWGTKELWAEFKAKDGSSRAITMW